MKKISGNIFYPHTYRPTLKQVDAICITSNGFVRRDGACVMGRGVAQQAAELFPKLPKALGTKINTAGNNVHYFTFNNALFNYYVVSFPVKPQKDAFSGSNVVAHMQHQFKIGGTVPGWACKAQLSIVKRSCKQLVALVDEKGWKTVVLPHAGCGAGELLWSDVRPEIEKILDDRFYCIML
jgi:hypothetical protein